MIATMAGDATGADASFSFARDRRDRLLRALQRDGSIRVTDMARQMDVSEVTIRRDIRHLVERGLGERVYGGAILPRQAEPGSPDDSAVRLRPTIGLVVPSVDYYWPSIIAGAREGAAAADVNLVIRYASYDIKDYFGHVHRLSKIPGVVGMVLAPVLESSLGPEYLQQLLQLRMPVVLADREPPVSDVRLPLEWVSSDHSRGARMAVSHLHQLGHRRIGLLVLEDGPSHVRVMRGWKEEMGMRGLSTEPNATVVSSSQGFTKPGREKLMAALVDKCAETGVTALLVHSDVAAVVLVQYLLDHGVAVPGDLSIVGYDDELAELSRPRLTAVSPPKEEVGRLAVEMAAARVREGDSRPLYRTLISPRLRVRDSCGPPVESSLVSSRA